MTDLITDSVTDLIAILDGSGVPARRLGDTDPDTAAKNPVASVVWSGFADRRIICSVSVEADAWDRVGKNFAAAYDAVAAHSDWTVFPDTAGIQWDAPPPGKTARPDKGWASFECAGPLVAPSEAITDLDESGRPGYTAGYEAGEVAGYADGETAGTAAGYDTGYEAGETAGTAAGYADGETAGTAAGYADAISDAGVRIGTGAYLDGFIRGAAGWNQPNYWSNANAATESLNDTNLRRVYQWAAGIGYSDGFFSDPFGTSLPDTKAAWDAAYDAAYNNTDLDP